MGRPLPSITNLPMQQVIGFLPAAVVTCFITLTAVFSVFTAVIFLCGAHKGMMDSAMGKEKTKTVRLGGENKKRVQVEKVKSGRMSCKSLLMSKMSSWRKVNDDDVDNDEADEDGGAVWKKGIIRGEKCRPLEFSGKILYDAHGNLLQD